MNTLATAEGLNGKVVIVTRPYNQSQELSAFLIKRGAYVIELPTIAVEFESARDSLRVGLKELPQADWVVFTSVNGVLAAQRLLDNSDQQEATHLRGQIQSTKIAAIGSKTAAAVNAWLGRKPDAVPDKFITTAIPGVLGSTSGKRILLLRADIATQELPSELKKLGAIVHDCVAYTVSDEPSQELARSFKVAVSRMVPEVVTFTSPSTVRGFIKYLEVIDRTDLLTQLTIAAIGPVTAREVERFGVKPAIVPERYTAESLAEEIVSYFS